MDYINTNGTESIEELDSIITANIRFHKKRREEYKGILEAKSKLEKATEKTESENLAEIVDEEKVDSKKTDDELEYFFSEFMSIPDEELETTYLESLPSIKHEKYHEIIIKMLLKLNESLKDYQLLYRDNTLTIDDYIYIKQMILEINKRRNLLLKAYYKEIEDEQEMQIENQLLFSKTPTGNVQVIEEIKSIDPSFYERIKVLLDSIKNGTFKNVKRFVSNSKLKGFAEVKEYQVRVVFERISINQYVIISIFTKKSDKDKNYRENLELKINRYKTEKEQIENLRTEADYIDKNTNIENELLSLLEGEVKKK